MFAVVEFTEFNEVAVVPENWLINERSSWWPKCKSDFTIRKHAEARTQPDDIKFAVYATRTFDQRYKTYTAARNNLKVAEQQSELNSDVDVVLTKRKATVTKRQVQNDSSDSDENVPKQLYIPNKKPSLMLVTAASTSVPPPPSPNVSVAKRSNIEVNIDSPNDLAIPSPTAVNQLQLPVMTVSTPNTSQALFENMSEELQSQGPSSNIRPMTSRGFQEWVVRQLTLVKVQQSEILDALNVIMASGQLNSAQGNSKNAGETTVNFNLPASTEEELQALYDSIVEKENRDKLVTKLALKGGNNLGDCVRRCMKGIMKDQVAVNYSWIGSRGEKKSFKATNLFPVILEAVRKNGKFSHFKESEIEVAAKDWLKNSIKRLNKKLGKQPQEPNDPESPLAEPTTPV